LDDGVGQSYKQIIVF